MAKNGELAKAYIQIVPSAQGIKGSIQNVLDGEADSSGKKAGSTIATSIKRIIATVGIGKALSSALMEGANLQQSLGGIDTLFKDHADKVKEYAKVAYETAGISANSYMEQATSFSASLLQSLGGDTAKAAEIANTAIIDMADNSNKMGTSLEMIQNAYQGFAKQNYTMLDNLKLGYGGTKTEMERLLADAQKISGVKYNISNLSDVYEAIHVIQGKLKITGTTSKEAATTLSGSFASMKAAASNFLGNLVLGEDIKPALEGLINTTSTFLFENLIPSIGNMIAAIPVVISNGIPKVMQEGKNMLESLISAIQSKFPQLLQSGTDSLVNFISGILNNLPSLIQTGGNLIVNLVNSIIQNLPNILESGYKIVSSLVSGVINNLPQILESGIKLVGKIAEGIVNGIPGLISKALTIFSKIKENFSSLDWISIGKNIINGIKNGISNAASSLVTAAKNAAKKALDAVKNFLGIHSPSRVFDTEVGKMITLGLANGIENNIKPVTDAMNILNSETMDAFNADLTATKYLNMATGEESSTNMLTQILAILSSIDAKTEKDYSFSINGRQVAYAIGEDMNIVLNKLSKSEIRRG